MEIGKQMLETRKVDMPSPFEVIGILLLAAMISCIVITIRHKPQPVIKEVNFKCFQSWYRTGIISFVVQLVPALFHPGCIGFHPAQPGDHVDEHQLILNSVNINFIAFNKYLWPGKIDGLFFALFIIAIAAAGSGSSHRHHY